MRFAVIGVICTLAFAVAYSLLRRALGPIEANLAALSLTITLNFLANRRYTFQAADGQIERQLPGYAVVYLIGLGVSSAVLAIALKLAGPQPASLETLLALAAGFAATVVRFVLLSAWVFRAPSPRVSTQRAGIPAGLTVEEPGG